MDALGKFLADRSFTFNDITISKRSDINQIGDRWIQEGCEEPVDLAEWESFVSKMDIWLDVSRNEIHYVAGIIPTLKWRGGKLGVRLAFLPKDISKLFSVYREAYSAARKTEKAKEKVEIRLYPKNLCEFLEKNLNENFATQLVISTHSSHVARETDFADLRYFKRLSEGSESTIATSKVINLSDVFGKVFYSISEQIFSIFKSIILVYHRIVAPLLGFLCFAIQLYQRLVPFSCFYVKTPI